MSIRKKSDNSGYERIRLSDCDLVTKSRKGLIRVRQGAGDGHVAEVDAEAWDRTLMLLTYELEASVMRFGGDMLAEVRNRIDRLEAELAGDAGAKVAQKQPKESTADPEDLEYIDSEEDEEQEDAENEEDADESDRAKDL